MSAQGNESTPIQWVNARNRVEQAQAELHVALREEEALYSQLQKERESAVYVNLTTMQKAVWKCGVRGMTIYLISKELRLHQNTVSDHIRKILRKVYGDSFVGAPGDFLALVRGYVLIPEQLERRNEKPKYSHRVRHATATRHLGSGWRRASPDASGTGRRSLGEGHVDRHGQPECNLQLQAQHD